MITQYSETIVRDIFRCKANSLETISIVELLVQFTTLRMEGKIIGINNIDVRNMVQCTENWLQTIPIDKL